MDPLPDFGLFELLVATGVAALARRIYGAQWVAFVFLVGSVVAPVVLLFVVKGEAARWIAAACLATALVNAGLIFPLLRSGRLPELLTRDPKAATGGPDPEQQG